MVAVTRIPAVTETKTVEVTPEKFTLTLSRAEAEVLRDIFDRVGGDPGKTRRGLTDDMNRALRDVIGYGRSAKDISKTSNAIYFLSEEEVAAQKRKDEDMSKIGEQRVRYPVEQKYNYTPYDRLRY